MMLRLDVGGAISKHLEIGDSVFILIMSKGEKGNHASKLGECLCSLKLIGVEKENIVLGNFPDGFIKDDLTTVSFVEKQIDKFSIDRVYTHHYEDRHQDHRNCSYAVSAAARRKVKEVFLFQGPSTKVTFEPHYFIGLSEEHMIKKIESLNCYKTQVEKGILNIEVIKALARFHGFNHDCIYAEAFEANHVFRGENEV
jgi:LmbE family N-acetylglucosaminyl deacetylase